MSCEHHTEAEHHGAWAAGGDEHVPLPSGRAGGILKKEKAGM